MFVVKGIKRVPVDLTRRKKLSSNCKSRMATVLITGGTGLVGKALSRRLQERGFEVSVLSRTKQLSEQVPFYTWDISKGEIDPEAIATADYIIHLSGVNIGEKRWSRKRKQEILESRINSGQLIYEEVRKQDKKLRAFISASAIGYYGSATSPEIFNELDPPGEDFLGLTCRAWEQVADRFQDAGIRTVKIRTGVVLTNQGGVFSKMLIPIKIGFGAALGNGKQYFPWIHMDDLCGIYIRAIEEARMIGAYNAVAPEHLTNIEFTQTLAQALNRTLWAPDIPAFVLKLVFGKMSEILLQGSRVSSDNIQTAGYKFQYPGIQGALKNLVQ